jgi:6-phosphogluconate dehydrogenase
MAKIDTELRIPISEAAPGASRPACEMGIIGLGVMGRNFALNLSDNGFCVAGFDSDPGRIDALLKEGKPEGVQGAASLASFISMLRSPRAVMLLVPAGAPVDAVIGELLPLLGNGDLIIDAGNSHFIDTDRRERLLAEHQVQFLGVGISGGESGARLGPSIMVGGERKAYERVRGLFEAAAAQLNGKPCVACLGPGSAGHFVKMVHNGIEYGLMQLISESYDLMKRGLGLSDEELHEFYAGWNSGEMEAYLIEITSQIFLKRDTKTGHRLIDEVRDVADQLGTGIWTSKAALDLHVPIPTIDAAVAMRHMSVLTSQREAANQALASTAVTFSGDRIQFLRQLGRALYAGTIITFAQGFSVFKSASECYSYGLDLSEIARIWRGGCIIRAALLESIWEAYLNRPALPNLLLDAGIANRVSLHQEDLRSVVRTAASLGLPAPGLMSALGYMDAYRSRWLPANLIEAQRDYFGAHRFELIGEPGEFHAVWGTK